MPSKYENKTIEELKEMCRQNNINGYSKLNKEDLIKHVKKNMKAKNEKGKQSVQNFYKGEIIDNKKKFFSKKMKGGNGYTFQTNTELKTAVDMWCKETPNKNQEKDKWYDNEMRNKVLSKYGHISTWDTSKVTNMSKLFFRKDYFNEDISNWDVHNVTSMYSMFGGAISFTCDLSDWNVQNVTNMNGMFLVATSFASDISAWDVRNVTNMQGMFNNATSFNSDISRWNVQNVTNMDSMFQIATSFNSDISRWNVQNVTDMRGMFCVATSFASDISAWDVHNVTNMGYMFNDASSFTCDISAWDISNVKNMKDMFDGCPIEENHKPRIKIPLETYKKYLVWSSSNVNKPTIKNKNKTIIVNKFNTNINRSNLKNHYTVSNVPNKIIESNNSNNHIKSFNLNSINVFSQQYLMESPYPWVKLIKTEYVTLKTMKDYIQQRYTLNPFTRRPFSVDFLAVIASLPNDNRKALNFLKALEK